MKQKSVLFSPLVTSKPRNPDSRGYHGKLTPLCEAAFAGHLEAVGFRVSGLATLRP